MLLLNVYFTLKFHDKVDLLIMITTYIFFIDYQFSLNNQFVADKYYRVEIVN